MMSNLKSLVEKGPVNVISIGCDMKCKKVLATGILRKSGSDYILRSEGINILCNDFLNDFMIDTPENRKKLKEQIQ